LNFLAALVRIIFKITIEAIHRLIINIFDTLFGFLNWPEKKLRIKIFILPAPQDHPLPSVSDLNASIEFAKKSFKKNFNVKLLPHHNGKFVEVLQTIPPSEVWYTKGGPASLIEEFKTAGSFFASNLSGYFHPVTAFVVVNIKGATGCSLGPVTDYITMDANGAKSPSVLAHELAHACGLWHVKDGSNLLYPNNRRGDDVKWWQKIFFRASRHVTYW
jgi:hypothetical protein